MATQVMFIVISLIGVITATRLQDVSQYDLIDGSTLSNSAPGKLGIFQGKTSNIKKFPYMVSLVQNGNSYCAGTILNENWVLTNGDCVKNRSASDITLVSGSNDGVTGTIYVVKQIVSHPNYGKKSLDYDYACVQIDGAFKWSRKVKAAKLPTASIADYTWLDVAGYGSTSSTGDSATNKLLQGKLQWLNKDVCKTMLSTVTTWSDNFACAYNAGQTTLCKGDFGDGLVKDNVVYGIFTAGLTKNFCTVNSMPCIVADVLPVVQWIISTISVC